MNHYRLHMVTNYPDGDEEDQAAYGNVFDADDLLGIIKTHLEYADKASSFVFTVVREEEKPEHKIEGTQANFDRYIAGDR